MAEKRKSRVGKAIFGVYVPQELAERTKKFMVAEKRTLTYVVIEAVDQFLTKRKF